MAHRRLGLEPTANPAEMFGEALRFARERAGYTQGQLGKLLHLDRTVITRFEGGRRPMDRETVEKADGILAMGGLLVRLWERVDWQADIETPDWFEKFMELEDEALAIRVLQFNRINGLLQCEEYVRAMISTGKWRNNPKRYAELVETRVKRQGRFLVAEGPTLMVVLDESAIRTVIGGPGVMRRQMEHLLAVTERSNIVVEVMPFGSPPATTPATSMVLMLMPDGKEWVYSESLHRGHFSDAPSVVEESRRDFDLVRTGVLSPGDTRALIVDAMEEYRFAERRSQEGGLAQEQLQRGRRGRVHRSGPWLPVRRRPGA
ncbi:XRE family transcriptional regulator [Kitasatospora xanthocidica]|uniref:XRE family transcriptional regulator n=1 Tax=Kitasatospora xanthocidica TaxID=83382 RepID=A0A372ZRM0_9ACTN|nr:helix-turn-helix transcriptional regulator [Kitasatospora xanthocidica]RGD58112.1 XRE family transcriptional regulator [Kitasatospora xanthocidica]